MSSTLKQWAWRTRKFLYQQQQKQLPTYILLSYPKSGRTWARFMIDLYLTKRYQRPFQNVFHIESDGVVMRRHHIQFKHFVDHLLYYEIGRFPERSVLVPKSHAVLLTRNIYATLASYYHHLCYRIHWFSGSPSEFLRHPKHGAIKILSFYNLWTRLRSEFLTSKVFSYEALRSNTPVVLRELLESLGVGTVDEEILAEVVAEASFQRMQELALSDAYRGTVLGPTDVLNKSSWKVREGKTDSYRTLFSDDDLKFVERLIDDCLVEKQLVDISHS